MRVRGLAWESQVWTTSWDATGYLEFVRRCTEDFDDLAFRLEEIIDADDDRVVAIWSTYGTGRLSRAPVEMRTGMVCILEARRIVRVVLFMEPNDALRAVGLRE